MIARIKGILSEIENNKGIIETSAGISYQAYLTPGIINRYPLLSEVSLYTHLQVREDALTLFAFESAWDVLEAVPNPTPAPKSFNWREPILEVIMSMVFLKSILLPKLSVIFAITY